MFDGGDASMPKRLCLKAPSLRGTGATKALLCFDSPSVFPGVCTYVSRMYFLLAGSPNSFCFRRVGIRWVPRDRSRLGFAVRGLLGIADDYITSTPQHVGNPKSEGVRGANNPLEVFYFVVFLGSTCAAAGWQPTYF